LFFVLNSTKRKEEEEEKEKKKRKREKEEEKEEKEGQNKILKSREITKGKNTLAFS